MFKEKLSFSSSFQYLEMTFQFPVLFKEFKDLHEPCKKSIASCIEYKGMKNSEIGSPETLSPMNSKSKINRCEWMPQMPK